MQIGEICSREVHVVRREEALVEAVREMVSGHIGAIVVVAPVGRDTVRPVGIITDRDVVNAQIDLSTDMFSLTAGDVMTPDPLTIEETCGLAEGIAQLTARGVRRAPVVDAAGHLVGLISVDDLLPVVAEEIAALAKLVGTQAAREGMTRG